ncbi:hypothetical protein GH714_003964 [Hevea brasiliensis]|uniref:WRKY domain-containing protein n=1 Tax=Hevea brasiliensis TaxID=3981 RepID=A0A6A6MBK0_HEVBR|nr:hypothetical protein GH714_003964 [Hevea brasiliensis]
MDGKFNTNPLITKQEENDNTESGPDSPPFNLLNDMKTSTSSLKRCKRAIQKRVISVPIKDVEGSRLKGETAPPPSDSWAWRKYGQKPIKGSPYPRTNTDTDQTVSDLNFLLFAEDTTDVAVQRAALPENSRDEFSWFGEMETTSSTILESPIFADERSTAEADAAMFFPMREEDESLFADLGELPECSAVQAPPWSGPTGPDLLTLYIVITRVIKFIGGRIMHHKITK